MLQEPQQEDNVDHEGSYSTTTCRPQNSTGWEKKSQKMEANYFPSQKSLLFFLIPPAWTVSHFFNLLQDSPLFCHVYLSFLYPSSIQGSQEVRWQLSGWSGGLACFLPLHGAGHSVKRWLGQEVRNPRGDTLGDAESFCKSSWPRTASQI